MKRFTGILLSVVMISSIGTTTVLAEPASDISSGSQGEINLLTVPDEIDDTLDQQEAQAEEIAGSEDSEPEDNAEELAAEDAVEEPESEDNSEEGTLEETDAEGEEESDETEIMPLAAGVEVDYTDLTLELQYDDRYDLSDLGVVFSEGEEYVIYAPEGEQTIDSYQVSKGEATKEQDTDLITLKEENSTEVIATGVGTGTVYLVRSDDLDDLTDALEEEEAENLDDQNGDSDGGKVNEDQNADGSNEDTIEAYKIEVTVEQAPLTLMFLVGQSNMDGYCDSINGYDIGASIACEEGTVYSTYVPWGQSKAREITGITFSEVCSTSNYSTTAGDFVAGSLQSDTNMSGGQLEYPLNSLTAEGGGKTGPDSGLAYEWNQRTGDKVWVVNTAYGATDIAGWVPGGSYYQRSLEIWKYVLQTYNAEIEAGHYKVGYIGDQKLVFWQQGETGDATNLDAFTYESQFSKMYADMSDFFGDDAQPFGIIMVRAGYATNKGSDYRDENDLKMTGPRIAQYWLGSGASPYSNVFVVSNANEQWVSDSGVKSYFQGKTYPTHNGNVSGPTTVEEVHYDIHYSQIGHNENGITAADGILEALSGSASPRSVFWRDEDGKTISSLTLELSTDTALAVPVVYPGSAEKQLNVSISGNVISYDASTGIVKAVSEATAGTGEMVASAGSKAATLQFKITTPVDLSAKAGSKYTGLYKYNGIWWYLDNGIIQPNYEGVVKNENGWWYVLDGRVDFTYTGFAENSNGWWYIEDGKVTFNKNSVIKDTNKKINGSTDWWYVVGSKVQTSYTGVADYKNSNGWWYIKNGKVDFTANTVAKNKNGWWYVDGGKVQFSYNGFGSNSNGKWYCEGGKVTFNKNSVIKDTSGAIGTKGTWYYVVGSKVQTSYTGVADYKNSNGWWYIKNGKVDFSANTVAKNKNGWWYVLGGKVQFNFTGLANYKNSNGWWYIKGGKVDFTHSGVDKNKNGWWYVNGGKVNFSFNGIAQNSNGWWYIKNGKVDFSYTGKVMVSGISYSVTNGKVAR